MAKFLGVLTVLLGVLLFSLLFSANPTLIFGSVLIGFGLGCFVWN